VRRAELMANELMTNGLIQWAAHGQTAPVEDVGVDHGGLHIFVAEKFLDGAAARVVAVFQKVCGERVPKGVAGNALDKFGMLGGGAHAFLEN